MNDAVALGLGADRDAERRGIGAGDQTDVLLADDAFGLALAGARIGRVYKNVYLLGETA